ncbi:MAG TPA: SDR family oxidoreductase [Bacillus sp. (in: firmicutes)]|uniref:SDR family NAD(P)-dependent oxidoreductase n=1 Tax=Bacillus litorisediminis TaxID=2922713 RepID=UPI001FAE4389|nr:SDR family oxidoreductase [Bacillus litorisediminis]HWO75750.1 SDR family oxidoreductase [Bacillus sp. (in: firmicutes)]
MINDRLNGKNVVITGASSGIGAKIAVLCAQSGANVILLARSWDKLQTLKQEIEENYPVSVWIYKLDIANTDEIQRIFAQITAEVPSIDVLVNNAGFGIFETVEEAKIEHAKAMFETNVIGLIGCTKMVLPGMKARKQGHIINIASIAGKIATPKSSIYSATKHAVLGFTNALRLEVAEDGIFVTAVNPGPIETNFFNIADQTGSYVKNVRKIMLSSDQVAGAVVKRMLSRTREINLPRWMNAGDVLFTLFPKTFERLGKKAIFKK